jgi:hypothetical protein
MTKGVYRGKQKKKAGHQQPKATPEPINQKYQSDSQTEDGSSAAQHSNKEVDATVQETNWREQCWNWLERRSKALQVIVPSIFSLLILAAIIAQAVIYHRQWKSMQSSLRETQRNREIEYRAYVVVRTATFTPSKDMPGLGLGDITVTEFNSGRTPATGKIQAMLDYRVDSPPEDTPIRLNPNAVRSQIVFAPTVDVNTFVSVWPMTQPPPQVNNSRGSKPPKSSPTPSPVATPAVAVAQKENIYIFGRIDYIDIFGHPHWTKFCLFNIPESQTGWHFCPTYNSTDQENPN